MDWKERKQQVCQAGTQINLFALNGVLTIGRLNQRYDKKGAFGGVHQSGTYRQPSALADLSKRKLIEKKKIYYFSSVDSKLVQFELRSA
jgi:hypothetical protein